MNRDEGTGTKSEARSYALYALLISVGAALCVLSFWFVETRELSANLLFADPAKATRSPFYLGAFSILGLILWTTAAVLCAVGTRLARTDARALEMRRFLTGGALISLVLLVDDWLLVHDYVGPQLLHLPQKVFYALYALLVSGWLWAGRRTIVAETPALYLAAAVFLGAVSVLIDTTAERSNATIVAEDGTKLLAIASWTFYFTRVSARLIAERTR